MARISIVIVNYKNAPDTLVCLASLERVTYDDFDVVVVDNDSRDGSFEKLETYCARTSLRAATIAAGGNLGFAGGCNVGIRYALERGSEYILLLNNDTTVAPDFLGHLVREAEHDPAIGVASPKIYFANDPERIWYDGAVFSWRDGGRHTRHGAMDKNKDDAAPRDTAYATGCAFLIKKDVIDKIGLMPEEYFLYYEDIDWSLAVQKAGHRTVVVPAAHIWHKISRSTSKLGDPRRQYYHIRNALMLTARHAPSRTKVFVYAWSMFHWKKQFLKRMFRKKSKPVAQAIVRGIADFWLGRSGNYEQHHDPHRG